MIDDVEVALWEYAVEGYDVSGAAYAGPNNTTMLERRGEAGWEAVNFTGNKILFKRMLALVPLNQLHEQESM